MVEFDSLPPTSRSLILATLGLEIASANCKNVVDLARKRNQSVSDVWRDVCRKTSQARCTMPPAVTRPDYLATAPSLEPSHAASAASAGIHAAASAAGMKPVVTHKSATGSSPAKGAVPTTSARHSFSSRSIALVVGLCAIVVIGVGIIIAMPRLTDQASLTTTSRPTEAVRVKSNETARVGTEQPNFVPPPQGTARRMEEINKAFTKR